MKNRIDANLEQLSTDELCHLAERLHDLIESRKMAEAIAIDVTAPAHTAKGRKTPKRNSGEWEEVKTINGKQYRYRRWWENGKKRSEYVGKA